MNTAGDRRAETLAGLVARSGDNLSFGHQDVVVRYERPEGVDSQEFRQGHLVRWQPGEIAATDCPVVTLSTHLPGIRLPSPVGGGDATAWCFGWEDEEPDPCPPLGPPPLPEDGEGWPGATAIVGLTVHGTPFGSTSTRWTIVDGLVREITALTTAGSDLVLEMPLDALLTGQAPMSNFGQPGCVAHGPTELAMMVGGLLELASEGTPPSLGPARAAAVIADLGSEGGLAQLDTWSQGEAGTSR